MEATFLQFGGNLHSKARPYCRNIALGGGVVRYEFCPKCGVKLAARNAGDDGLVPYCAECDRYWFDSFASCVIVLVHDGVGHVVVARQSYISQDYGLFTSGFIAPGESAEAAATREVREELGVEPLDLAYAGSYWYAPGEMLMHGFVCRAGGRELRLSEEVDSARWVPEDDVPKEVSPDVAAVGVFKVYLEMRGKRTDWKAEL